MCRKCGSSFDFLSEPPSLQHIASVSIAVRLWTLAGINMVKLRENPQERCSYNWPEYCSLRETALKKVNELLLPKSVRLNITHAMKPIGLQLKHFFDCKFDNLHKEGGSIYWTVDGLIDQVKSFKELISKNENVHHWYELACKYCLEENILDIGSKIEVVPTLCYACENYNCHIIAYWTFVLNNMLPDLMTKLILFDKYNVYKLSFSVYANMIWSSMIVGNVSALKYFWHKLTDQEKNANIESWATILVNWIDNGEYSYQTYNVYTEMLWFMLSNVNDIEKQKHIFCLHARIILKSFIFHWPFQRYFLPAMIEIMDFIEIDIYASIMKDLLLEVKDGRMTGKLFRTVWYLSPLKFQKHFLLTLKETKLFVISSLLSEGDIKTISILVSSDSVEEKRAIIANSVDLQVLIQLMRSNKLNFLDALLSELLSNNDIYAFKQHIMVTYAKDLCCDCIFKRNYNAVEQLLSWGLQCVNDVQRFKRCQLNANEIFISLMQFGDSENVDKFLSWYFGCKEDVIQFKIALMSRDNMFYCKKLLFELSFLDEHGWNIFVNHCDCFSGAYLMKKLPLKEVVGHILKAHNLTFASLFLNWCLGSVEEVNRFKNELLLSNWGAEAILETLSEIPNWSKTKSVLKWFSPFSSDSVAKIMYTLTTDKFRFKCCIYHPRNQRRALFYLLNRFVDNSEKYDFAHDYEYDWDVNKILLAKWM